MTSIRGAVEVEPRGEAPDAFGVPDRPMQGACLPLELLLVGEDRA
jgi:hypothetical protein